MQTDLRVIIDKASQIIEMLFDDTGFVTPMWEAITDDNRHLLIPVPPEAMQDKDQASKTLRAYFAKEKVIACLFISEAWVATIEANDDSEVSRKAMQGGSLENYPGRIEVVTFLAEDEDGFLQGQRRIIRNLTIRADSKPTLGPLEYLPIKHEVSGRFVGMLPRTKTLQ